MRFRLDDRQIERYLERIGLTGPLPLKAETLAAIQWAHLQTLPFEALDITPLNVAFTLDVGDIYGKIIGRHRGGFCFELNGLLAVLLESLGFEVERHAAYFTNEPVEHAHPFDHMTLNVTVPGEGSRWLVDVAAGQQNPPLPIPFGASAADGCFRTRLINDCWHFEKRGDGDTWIPQIAWRTKVQLVEDFQERCLFFQDHPESPFKMGPLCTLMTPGGRITISKWTLITTENDERTEYVIPSEIELRSILKQKFAIEFDFATWWEEPKT